MEQERRMRLIDAPVGVFRFSGDLVLKTEYMVDIDGVWIPDCYILDSGEKFWGGMKSKDDFKTKYNDLEVEVVDVEPQRMRGRWERTVIGKARHIICSSCKVGYYAQDVPHDLSGNVAWKYCPECGADMRGGQDEDYRR